MIQTKNLTHSFESLSDAAPIHTPRSISEQFKIPAGTIRAATYHGRLDSINLGKKVLIPDICLTDWIVKSRVEPCASVKETADTK